MESIKLEQKIDRLQENVSSLDKHIVILVGKIDRHDELSRKNARDIELLQQENSEMKGALRLGKFITAFVLSCLVALANWVVSRESKKDDGQIELKEMVTNNRHSNELINERLKIIERELDKKGADK